MPWKADSPDKKQTMKVLRLDRAFIVWSLMPFQRMLALWKNLMGFMKIS